MRWRGAVRLAVVALVVSCSSSSSTTPTNTNSVTMTAGDGQSGFADVALPTKLQVVVKDPNGAPLAGQTITWAGTGGAQPFPTTSVTDAAGSATTTLILGAATGPQGATAALSGGKTATFSATATGAAPAVTISVLDGSGQIGSGGIPLPAPLRAIVRDQSGAPAPGRLVQWQVTSGTGHVASAASLSGNDGTATTILTPGTEPTQSVTASVAGATVATFAVRGYAGRLSLSLGDPFSGLDTTCVALHKPILAVVLDSLLRGQPGLTVTLSSTAPGDHLVYDSVVTNGLGAGFDTLYLSALPGTHTVQIAVPGTNATTTATFVTQSPCASVFTAAVETGTRTVSRGTLVPVYAYVSNDSGTQTQHVVTWTVISGGGSVSPATTPSGGPNELTTFTVGPATGTQVLRASSPGFADVDLTFTVLPGTPILVATVPMPTGATYDHDAFVRDGIAFVFAWNKGVLIYDVGNGMKGGSPSSPQLISELITSDDGVAGGPSVHNGWWFQNPVTGEKKYLFIGQEGPGIVGSASTGDIHIVDVSDLAHPVEVGFIHIPGAGTHNFWMDEANQVLYAAYYNAGVVKIDVSGTLSGDMSSRIVKQVLPGGAGHTYTWGVMLANGTLYASDMVSGFWALDPATLAVKGGGNNLPSFFGRGSDLWVAGNVGYSGNWGDGDGGSRIAIWSLGADGSPTLANTLILAGGTMSDVAVTPDGRMLVGTTEGGSSGLYIWDRADPIHPVLVAVYPVLEGLHTAETKVVNGRTYVFAARDPNKQQLMIFDITDVVQ